MLWKVLSYYESVPSLRNEGVSFEPVKCSGVLGFSAFWKYYNFHKPFKNASAMDFLRKGVGAKVFWSHDDLILQFALFAHCSVQIEIIAYAVYHDRLVQNLLVWIFYRKSLFRFPEDWSIV